MWIWVTGEWIQFFKPWEFAVFRTVSMQIDHHLRAEGYHNSVPQGCSHSPASRRRNGMGGCHGRMHTSEAASGYEADT